MLRPTLFSLFCLFSHLSYSQPLAGRIIDHDTQKPLPYVNISLLGKKSGTVSDANGYFQLNPDSGGPTDTVGFSMIGYSPLTITLNALSSMLAKKQGHVHLTATAMHLQEVVVAPVDYSYRREGNGNGKKRMKIGFGPNDNLGREIGTLIQNEGEAFIEDISITIAKNEYGNIKMRLNIYEWENGKPGKQINTVPVYVETDVTTGVWKADVSKYALRVNGDFFISYQYIEDMGQYGLYFAFSLNKAPTLWRESALAEWQSEQHDDKNISISINTTLAYSK